MTSETSPAPRSSPGEAPRAKSGAPSPEGGVFLRQGTKIEPLCCRWYAWPHLLPPVQQALNVAFRQLPLLKSFLAGPGVHEAAARDPTLMGGSFVHLTRTDVPAVRALVADMSRRCARLLQFAEDLVEFDRRLQAEAKGQDVDHLYGTLPPTLAGVTEITYNLNSHPTLRILEELLYDDSQGRLATQELAFSRGHDEERRFFLNTPRLDAPERLVVPVPFSHPGLDLLARSRLAPIRFDDLAEGLGLGPDARIRLREYFSSEPPARRAPAYAGDDVRVRYFNHACVLVQTSRVSILVDPLFAWDPDEGDGRLTFDDLPDHLDYVFLTHAHHDHFNPEALLQLRDRVGRVLVPRSNPHSLADPSMRLMLDSLGFRNVTVMDPLDTVAIDGGWLASVPFYGEHAALDIASKHGLYLALKGRRLAFLADANCLDRALYRRVVQRLGRADVLFIGMECRGAPLTWIYGPYLTHPISRKHDESRRTNGSDADRAWVTLEELGSSRVFVYAMGQEPWLRYHLDLIYTPESKQFVEAHKFLDRCRAAAVPARHLEGSCEMIL